MTHRHNPIVCITSNWLKYESIERMEGKNCFHSRQNIWRNLNNKIGFLVEFDETIKSTTYSNKISLLFYYIFFYRAAVFDYKTTKIIVFFFYFTFMFCTANWNQSFAHNRTIDWVCVRFISTIWLQVNCTKCLAYIAKMKETILRFLSEALSIYFNLQKTSSIMSKWNANM